MTEKIARETQANKLLRVASNLRLFRSGDDQFASIDVGEHTEVWSLNSPAMANYLSKMYYRANLDVPNRQSLESAIGLLKGRAQFDGEIEEVFIRIAPKDGNIYVDLCNDTWQVVEITPYGWSVLDESPVKFMRPSTPAPLPTPEDGGDLRDVLNYLNIEWSDFPMAIGWVIGSYMPSGPYPILVVGGEQGSTKSTTCKVLKSLVDPSKPELGSPPANVGDFIITAKYSWVFSIDNISHIQSWLSDSLCRLSTGGGISKRRLYTDEDEITLNAIRPTIINGIGDPGTRSDFLDRMVQITCPSFIDGRIRKPEREFWAGWDKAHPRILGAVFTAVSAALRNVGDIHLDDLPRMADFAQWLAASAPAIGMTAHDILDCYESNRRGVHELALESSVVAVEVLRFIERVGEWSGTATDLLNQLELYLDRDTRRMDKWPKDGRSLSNILSRMSPNLRAFGVALSKSKEGTGANQRRRINIKFTEPSEIVHQKLRAVRGVSINPRNMVDD